jgi:hypothetical protein
VKLLTTKTDTFIFLFICGLFTYVASRAALIDITHDEAYSFYNMKKFWYAEALCTGNTHWLNSAAIKSAILLKQESLLAIRWLSIFSAFVFFSLSFLWIRSVKEIHFKFLILAILLLNPYILDYFSMARGYAPGLMFQGLALFYLARAIKNEGMYSKDLSLLFAGLSPLSNFSYIYFLLGFCLVYYSVFYFRNGFSFFKDKKFYRDSIYIIGVCAIVIRAFMFMTKCSNDVVGAGTPLLSEYFHVFTDGLIYRKLFISIEQLNALSIFVFLMISLSILYGIFARRKHADKFYLYTSCMLAIIISVSFINYFVFGLVLPYYRSAIFLFPTTDVCFIYFLKYVLKNVIVEKSLVYVVSLLLAINFFCSVNFKWVFDFYIQANLKQSFDFVQNAGAKNVGISPELYGGFRNYYQMTGLYKYHFKGEQINTNLPKGIGANTDKLNEFDYVILFPPYDLSYYRNNKVNFEGLTMFPETGTIVLKTRH